MRLEENSLISGVIKSLAMQHDKMIEEALKDFGFSKEYVMSHVNDFFIGIKRNPMCDEEYYYYNKKLMFVFKMETSIDTCETKMTISYNKNYNKLEKGD